MVGQELKRRQADEFERRLWRALKGMPVSVPGKTSLPQFMRIHGEGLFAAREAGHAVPELIALMVKAGFDYKLTPGKFSTALSLHRPRTSIPKAGSKTRRVANAADRAALSRSSHVIRVGEDRPAEVTKEDLLWDLAPRTRALRASGLSWQEVAAKYAKAGFAVSVSYLMKADRLTRDGRPSNENMEDRHE